MFIILNLIPYIGLIIIMVMVIIYNVGLSEDWLAIQLRLYDEKLQNWCTSNVLSIWSTFRGGE